jgi:hypothetical protein
MPFNTFYTTILPLPLFYIGSDPNAHLATFSFLLSSTCHLRLQMRVSTEMSKAGSGGNALNLKQGRTTARSCAAIPVLNVLRTTAKRIGVTGIFERDLIWQ